MVLRNPGNVFEYEDGSFPSLVTTVSGSKLISSHCWKLCPYSAQSTNEAFDERVPSGEKTYHEETNGQMHSYSISGLMGWACADNGCSFFVGTATTKVDQKGRVFVPASGTTCDANGLATLSGTVELVVKPRTIVPGTRFLEI
jgi:hypothetical protein